MLGNVSIDLRTAESAPEDKTIVSLDMIRKMYNSGFPAPGGNYAEEVFRNSAEREGFRRFLGSRREYYTNPWHNVIAALDGVIEMASVEVDGKTQGLAPGEGECTNLNCGRFPTNISKKVCDGCLKNDVMLRIQVLEFYVCWVRHQQNARLELGSAEAEAETEGREEDGETNKDIGIRRTTHPNEDSSRECSLQ